MKKNILSFILGGLIFGTIGVGATYVYTARDISFLPSDENWNVTNASEAISSLKEDLNTVNNNVSEYKSNIAQTLTDNGITTNSNDSFETIDNNIDDGINNYKSQINTCNSNYSTLNTNFTNYKKGVTTSLKNKGVNVTESSTLAQVQSGINNMSTTNVYYLGTGTSFNIKTKFPNDYQRFTNSNFIVKFVKTNATNWTGMRNKGDRGDTSSNTSPDTNVSVSYNSSTGALTVSGTQVTSTHYNSWDNQYYYINHTVGVYLVDGSIKSV